MGLWNFRFVLREHLTIGMEFIEPEKEFSLALAAPFGNHNYTLSCRKFTQQV